jgi:hypothetical protein
LQELLAELKERLSELTAQQGEWRCVVTTPVVMSPRTAVS